MGELLLELLSEEVPARMQRRAVADLTGLLRDKLSRAEIPAADLRGHATPRRLVVIANGISSAQPERSEERRGPRVGAPLAAIDGFLRSAGLASTEQCLRRDTGRGEFYFAILRRPGRPTTEVLPELVAAAIAELPWPKAMRWPGSSLRWVRPLVSIICLYDGDIVPAPLAGVLVGSATTGHRFLAPGGFCVANAADYLDKLAHAYVVLDQDRRRDLIRADLERRAGELGLRVKPDPGLLDEVTGLVEFPVVLAGAIGLDFMDLPPEVLQTAMRTHQRYFSCADPDGRAAPHFLFVADNLAEDGGQAIVGGNERVLRARLADARFFWDQDRKIRLEDRTKALKTRIYHAKLGSLYDKATRIEKLATFLAEQLYCVVTPAQAGVQDGPSDRVAVDSRFRGNDDEELAPLAQRAAHLAKADLSTGMVGEFPELQGVIGRYYALHDGEDRRVADAIADHYKPQGPSDDCPSAPVSVTVALADKIDTLVAFFAIGEEPTGSRDPFALRRAALGVVRLIIENNLDLGLYPVLDRAEALAAGGRLVTARVLMFIVDRLKGYLRERGHRHDLIDAAFRKSDSAGSDDNLLHIIERAGALKAFLEIDDGANLLTAYRRAANIVRIEDRKDGSVRSVDVDAGLLVEPEEQRLAGILGAIVDSASRLASQARFEKAMEELARLREPVDEFFDKVTVNADEPELRENRLRLLARIRDTMNQIADFSQIEG